MQEKTWRIILRVFNLLSAFVLLGFEVWYIVALVMNYEWYDVVLRIFAPVFLL
jgi:hypothetical protein